MTNPYYNRITDFIPDTAVRSSDVDSELNAIVAGFDLLGDPTKIGNGGLLWGTDSGTANNYVYDNGGTDDLVAGQMISFSPLNSSTGASVVSYNSGDNMAIVRNDGAATQSNDILEGVPLILLLDIDNDRWVIIGSTAAQTLAAFRPGVNSQTGTTYTLQASDENKSVRLENAATIAVTVPNDTNDDFPIGYLAHIRQAGAGRVTLVPDTGVTLNYPEALTTRVEFSSLSVMKVAANTYDVLGDADV